MYQGRGKNNSETCPGFFTLHRYGNTLVERQEGDIEGYKSAPLKRITYLLSMPAYHVEELLRFPFVHLGVDHVLRPLALQHGDRALRRHHRHAGAAGDRGAADVRQQDDVLQLLQRRRHLGFLLEDVEPRAGDPLFPQRTNYRRFVDYRAACVHQQRFGADLAAVLDAPAGPVVALSPATVSSAPPFEDHDTGDPQFNSVWSFSGLSTCGVPACLGEDGLPLSLQLGAACESFALYQAAAWCEAVLEFPGGP